MTLSVPSPNSTTPITFAQRMEPLGYNVFAAMDRAKTQAAAAGKTVIDLSLGSVDFPTDPEILAAIAASLSDSRTHGYLLFAGTRDFREAVAAHYEANFGVPVDPETEVLPLIGSQEGTAYLPLALLNPGDVALLQDPGYPSHYGGVHLAGGEVYPMALRAEQGFLPVFEEIPAEVLHRSRLMVLNYPHNPTTAIADADFFQRAFAFCQRHNLVLAHDFAYAGMGLSDRPLPSMLQVDRAKERTIEFFTLSKAHNMGGFRVGYAIGNPALILALRQIKAVTDFNQYGGIFRGAITALQRPPERVRALGDRFRVRRDAFVAALAEIGWPVPKPEATMFVWAKLPDPWQGRSVEFCTQLVAATGVAVAPGVGFGRSGEGYVRFALVHDPEVLRNAVQQIAQFLG